MKALRQQASLAKHEKLKVEQKRLGQEIKTLHMRLKSMEDTLKIQHKDFDTLVSSLLDQAEGIFKNRDFASLLTF